MASTARSAPLTDALVAEPQFQEILRSSRSLTQRILESVEDTHKSCVHLQSLQWKVPENAKLATMRSTIGIPSAPVIKPISANFSLETALRAMHDGLELHHGLLRSISPRLEVKDRMNALQYDVRDLKIEIFRMLKIKTTEATVPPTPTSVELHLPGDYEVQVAAHLTLVQLQAFSQDVARCFRSLDRSDQEETDS
uniref:Uncharacterized protein n=1 Tax=Cyprinodon variegatus TaxID=28743 RepID=A0A3Q2CHK1_CYPVA